MKLAVAGKGGVGKTTIAGTLARVIAMTGHRVLALDADSNPNLAVSLGLSRDRAASVVPVPQTLGQWREDSAGKAYIELSLPIREVVDRYGVEAAERVQLLVMGQVEQAGIGCRCSAHAAARGITGCLVSEADMAVLDMEAGLEHLGRCTIEHVDTLLVVVEPYYRALDAGVRVRDLAAQLEVPRILVVSNRVRSSQDREAVTQYCHHHNLELIAQIPYDDAIPKAEERGEAALDFAPDGPAIREIHHLADRLLAMA